MDFDRRLTNLRDRRRGLSKLRKSMEVSASDEAARRSMLVESYERRATKKAIQYALGAMEEVNPEYTKNSIAEGKRIGSQLRNRLTNTWSVECELQGSVALNVHIEGVSDVDLLILRTDFCMFDMTGPKSNNYISMADISIASLISELRAACSAALSTAYPAATLDTSGAKSLRLSGGSLTRNVDVVPSVWHHSTAYQVSGEIKDKGVAILDIKAWKTITNYPFLHIHKVHTKDMHTNGGTKKVIRLLKNVKSDSDDVDKIMLSSYEIAGLVWHFDNSSLSVRVC